MKRTALLSLSLLLAGNLLPVFAIKANNDWKELATTGAMTLGFASTGFLAYAGYNRLKKAYPAQVETTKKATILGSKALGSVAATGVALLGGLHCAIAASDFMYLRSSLRDSLIVSATTLVSGFLACKLAESAYKDYKRA